MVSVWLAACARPVDVGPPVVAGLDADEADLVEYLQARIDAVRDTPGSAAARGELALAYDANGLNDAAIDTYLQAEALDAASFRWPYHRATALAEVDRHDEAISAVERALQLDSGYVPGWLWLGTWLLKQDRVDDAAAAFTQAGRLAVEAPMRTAASIGLARTHLRSGRAAEAAELLAPLAKPSQPYARQLLADARRRLGQEVAAPVGGSGAAAPMNWPDPVQVEKTAYVRGFSGRLRVAREMLDHRRGEQALAILLELQRSRPDDRDLINNLGVAYLMTARNEQAAQALKHGLALYPEHAPYHYNIGLYHEARQDDAQARQHFERAIALDASLAAAHQRLISLFVRGGDFGAAAAAIERATPVMQASPQAHFEAGMVAGALEQWQRAIAQFERAIALDADFGRAHLFLARCLGQVGRDADARAALTEAERLQVSASDIAAARAYLDQLQR